MGVFYRIYMEKVKLKNWDELVKTRLNPETIAVINVRVKHECKIFKSLHKIKNELRRLEKLLCTTPEDIPCSWCLLYREDEKQLISVKKTSK